VRRSPEIFDLRGLFLVPAAIQHDVWISTKCQKRKTIPMVVFSITVDGQISLNDELNVISTSNPLTMIAAWQKSERVLILLKWAYRYHACTIDHHSESY
jgi:hypothetical protein